MPSRSLGLYSDGSTEAFLDDCEQGHLKPRHTEVGALSKPFEFELRKRGVLPLAELFKRRNRRDLSMRPFPHARVALQRYTDDLTLMLVKARQGLRGLEIV